MLSCALTYDRWACRHWRNRSHVGEMLDDLQWLTLESRRNKASLSLCQISIDKDKYLSSASSVRQTRSSNQAQYQRPNVNTDA